MLSYNTMSQDNLINMNVNNLFKVLKIKLILGNICPHLTLKKRSEVQSNMIYGIPDIIPYKLVHVNTNKRLRFIEL